MKRCYCIRFVVMWSACLLSQAGDVCGSEDKPNILLVLFDDLGYGQPASYRAETKLKLPRLDQLAAEGMRFTDAHSASAVCTPTRYGLLTGRYPWRIGQFGVLQTFEKPIIPTTRLTIASMLKQQGYRTACVGKWHLGLNWVEASPKKAKVPAVGERYTEGPNELGFDYFCGFTHARNFGMIIEQDRVVEHVKPIENQPLLLERALAWLEKQSSDAPFFMYFPMCPPHTPIVPSEEFQGASGGKDLVKKDPKYADWVFQGDAMLGALLDKLQEKGLAENTLVIAASDNGAAGRPYAPLRAAKTSIYEGGHRVPMVVRWPGKVKAGSEWDHTVCLNDVIATTAELTGYELPDNAAEDSFSFLPAILGKTPEPTRGATVHQSHRGDLAIRRGEWKRVYHLKGEQELFNLNVDLGESTNVLGKYPEVDSQIEAVFRGYVRQGRSTPGEAQSNGKKMELRALKLQ